MTLEQLNVLHDHGWSIVSHTVSHRNLTTLSDEELKIELHASQEWIIEQGFNGNQVFIVPGHHWGPRELELISNLYSASRGLVYYRELGRLRQLNLIYVSRNNP